MSRSHIGPQVRIVLTFMRNKRVIVHSVGVFGSGTVHCSAKYKNTNSWDQFLLLFLMGQLVLGSRKRITEQGTVVSLFLLCSTHS